MNGRVFALVCIVGSCLVVPVARASHWSTSAEQNNPVSTAHSLQQTSVAVSDGDGGVISAWLDLRNELYFYVYAQRINANGDPMWTTDGVLLSNAGFNQQLPEIVSDGAGGAIVIWADQRVDTADLYAQRISATGAVLWNPGGVPIAVALNVQTLPRAIPDGSGGAIFAWTDARPNTQTDIYAQRINANGVVQWTANGLPVCTNTANQQRCNLATDGAGGAIIAWEDQRNDPANADVYAQRIRVEGTVAWTANGVPVAVQPFQQRDPVVSYAVGNGAYIAWEDSRAGGGADFHIYVQRLFSTGGPAFTVNGLKVSTSIGGDHFNPQITPTYTSGGAQWILWEYVSPGANDLILSSVGISGFIENEKPIDDGNGNNKTNPHLTTSNGEIAALITYTADSFYGPGASNIFVTKYPFDWGEPGVAACIADGAQGPSHVVSDDQEGAIVVWDDRRGGPGTSDIRAQRIDFLPSVGYWSPNITGILDHPQDQGGQVIVSWDKAENDGGATLVRQYTVWRRYQNPSAVFAPPSDQAVAGVVAEGVSAKLAQLQLASGWELVGTTPAMGLPTYALTAPTYADQMVGTYRTGFMVVFEIQDYGFWYSAPDSGFSVDNLLPTAPLELEGTTAGTGAQLEWTHPVQSPDVTGYNVYRAPSPGVSVSPGNLIAQVPSLEYLDTTIGGHPHFYIVTAIDDAAQEGPPSNEVMAPTGVTGVDALTPPVALSLVAAGPNPYRNRVMFRYGLPSQTEVSIAVFDVTGRQVHDVQLGHRPAGWHDHQLDMGAGGRPLKSGAYFLKLRAGNESRIMKFAVLK